jgi:hypothetical protein
MLVPTRAFLRACLALVDLQNDSERESQYAKHEKTLITQEGFSPAQEATRCSIETLCDESGGGGKVDANHSLIGLGRAL